MPVKMIPEYRSPQVVRPASDKRVLLPIAAILGALPLLIGTLIFVLWVATRSAFLMIGGFLTLLGGLAAFLVGMGLLAWHCYELWRRRMRPGRREFGVALLLVSNFPAAAAILAAVMYVRSAATLVVRNIGTAPVTSLRITNGYRWAEFGPLAPGATSTRTVHWMGGALRFVRVQNSQTVQGIVPGTARMDDDAIAGYRSSGANIETDDSGTVVLK